ncbi:MAG: pentapeptide repeat-containing protein [Acidimicrobiia bacterium]|nr:pentapeptide repeat-containing protein [Acidimicrobiia bacterium]
MRHINRSSLALIAGLIVGSMLTLSFTAGAANGNDMRAGRKNYAGSLTTIKGKGGLLLWNTTPAGEPAAWFRVTSGPPFAVNSTGLVKDLNADMVDGKDAADFFGRGEPLHAAGCPNCTGLTANAFGACLPGLDLTNASLTPGANFTAAHLDGALLMSGMPGADFTYASLVLADLSNAWVSDGSFRMADLTNANLAGALLDGVLFWGADLTGADLTDANLTGGNLTSAILAGTIWNNTTCPDGTNTDTNGDGDCDGVHRTSP